ncbi:hypothetical protein HPP92_028624 [Vanilla planifolia]|uniref:Uncharacterized protein n=1 Tax=Vanilla planifolia TaxID=51239 RepID=A0A835P6N5_VANPL|nr:hypothetical protein HPP92_028624 [Vanilla planifolia]KAG0446899.1 hypothetical protein HPP92_028619 [Vanilla planifolia]
MVAWACRDVLRLSGNIVTSMLVGMRGQPSWGIDLCRCGEPHLVIKAPHDDIYGVLAYAMSSRRSFCAFCDCNEYKVWDENPLVQLGNIWLPRKCSNRLSLSRFYSTCPFVYPLFFKLSVMRSLFILLHSRAIGDRVEFAASLKAFILPYHNPLIIPENKAGAVTNPSCGSQIRRKVTWAELEKRT